MAALVQHDPGSLAAGAMVSDLLEELRLRARTQKDRRPVTVHETHTSWVLLGPEVYKIKKPVRFPFLDFRTFEARERACRSEVRLNRRLAPRTYLGVVPVRRRRDGRFTLSADGVVVEWAVHMHRLEDAEQADRLLEIGRLERPAIAELASLLAHFHASGPSSVAIARAGTPEAVERNVAENFEALREHGPEFLSGEALAEIEAWQRSFLHAQRDLFERRMRDGAVRDGHGDLRLEHVFVTKKGRFEIIDAVEFDDRYRHGDVCADVAFLAMDLARLGRADLAEYFVASYAREANDFELYRLLDFYESYRACVRAKISVAAAVAPDAADDVVRRARAEARMYLTVAQAAHRRSLLGPMLIAVGGGIAAGKSTLAEHLAAELSAPVVDADRTRKSLLGVLPTSHIRSGVWEGAYDPRFSERVYEEVLLRAQHVLGSGRSVVLDASFRTAAARSKARELARASGAPFTFLECVAPAELCRARLAERPSDTSVSDATLDVYDSFVAGYEPVTELSPDEHVRIDTSGAIDHALAEVRARVQTWPKIGG